MGDHLNDVDVIDLTTLRLTPVEEISIGQPLPHIVFRSHIKYARRLGLQGVEGSAVGERLAIVGSGLSVKGALEELREWKGEIWAINGAWKWLEERGVPATFFSIDPLDAVVGFAERASRLVLQSSVTPKVFNSAIVREAQIWLYDPSSYQGSASSIGAAFAAIQAGYKEISFFGCECSYPPERVHLHTAQLDRESVVVDVLGEGFLTRAVYYYQALELSHLIRTFPGAFKERSGGLLGAMVAIPGDESPL